MGFRWVAKQLADMQNDLKRRALDEVHQLEEHRLSHMLMQPALATLRCWLDFVACQN